MVDAPRYAVAGAIMADLREKVGRVHLVARQHERFVRLDPTLCRPDSAARASTGPCVRQGPIKRAVVGAPRDEYVTRVRALKRTAPG